MRPSFLVLITLAALPVAGAVPAGDEAPADAGFVAGTVASDASHHPLDGATVLVEGGPAPVTSSADGRFRIAVAPGSHRLVVSHPCCLPYTQTDVVVSPGRDTFVAVALVDAPTRSEAVEVTASAFSNPAGSVGSAYSASHEEIRRAPGVLGDVNRLVQTFAGVAISNDQRNDVVARGGSPLENLTLVDGFEIENLNHFAAQGTTGGPISMLNTELIADVDFMAGGFSAAYGDRLSSALEVRLREGNRERFQSEFTLDTSGAGFVVEGPFSSKGSYLVSARRSFLDLLFDKFGGLTAVPHFSNYQAKLVYALGPRNTLTLVSIGGRDDIHFKVDESDLDDPSLQDVTFNGSRLMTGVSLQTLFGDRGFGKLSVSGASSSYATAVLDDQIGGQLLTRNDSTERDLTAKYDVVYRVAAATTVRAGAGGTRHSARYRIEQPIGLWNPYSVDPTRVDPLDVDARPVTGQTAAYAETTTRLGRFELTAGGRVDHYGLDRSTTVSPRAGASLEITPQLKASVSYGQYRQIPPLVFLATDPANLLLEPMRADHAIAGLAYLPARDVKITLEAYDKRYSRYPVATAYPEVSLANTGIFYGVDGLLFPMVSRGTGRSRGIDLYVQKKLASHFYGQLSYAYSRTEQAALDGVLRPGAFDSPHVLSLTGGYKFGERFELSSKFTAASGRPVTPYLYPQSAEQNRPIDDLSRVNGDRSPAYVRLDVRADRRFRWHGVNIVTFLDLQNALGRKNVLEYVWNPKTESRDSVKQLARFPLGGFTLEF